jgi:integrase
MADSETIDGVHVLRIAEDGPDQSVKTQAGLRVVPLHSELLRLGFLDYVSAIRGMKTARLFPALPLFMGKAGHYFSAWFSSARKIDAETVLPDFHSFRHTVRSKLASAHVADPLIDVLIGHEVRGSTGARTYTHRTMEDLRIAVERLSYPTLALSRVFTAPAWKPTK